MIQHSEFVSEEIIIEDIKNNLTALSNRSIPKGYHVQSLLKGLSVPIASLAKKGFSFSQISDMLKSLDITVSSSCINEFFLVEQWQRIANVESNYQHKLHHEAKSSDYISAEIENELRRSIHKNENLFLEYQPQINITTGKIIGAEALLRWKPKGVVIKPGDFIEIAERSDLIIELGDWILNEACREAKRWDGMSLGGDKPIKISVNLSVRQLNDQLPEIVNSVIRKNRISPESFGVEITESFMFQDRSIPVLRKLKDCGISLSMDDFGTGYSCLSVLKSLPLDVVKIDRSFVQNIETEYRSMMMIEFIVKLAQQFGMTTIAEGVETPKQVKILQDLGCNVCQGYHFSESLSGNDFIRFVEHGISETHL